MQLLIHFDPVRLEHLQERQITLNRVFPITPPMLQDVVGPRRRVMLTIRNRPIRIMRRLPDEHTVRGQEHYVVENHVPITQIPIVAQMTHQDISRKGPLVKMAGVDNHGVIINPDHIVVINPDHAAGVIINPGLYCKPIAKERRNMLATRKVMFGGYAKFNFGSDCAWHPAVNKKLAVDNNGKNPNAGIFNPFSLQIIVHEFMKAGAEVKILEKFLTNNARVYTLRSPKWVDEKITLVREPWTLPTDYNGTPIFMGGQTIDWQIKDWNWQDYLK